MKGYRLLKQSEVIEKGDLCKEFRAQKYYTPAPWHWVGKKKKDVVSHRCRIYSAEANKMSGENKSANVTG